MTIVETRRVLGLISTWLNEASVLVFVFGIFDLLKDQEWKWAAVTLVCVVISAFVLFFCAVHVKLMENSLE